MKAELHNSTLEEPVKRVMRGSAFMSRECMVAPSELMKSTSFRGMPSERERERRKGGIKRE